MTALKGAVFFLFKKYMASPVPTAPPSTYGLKSYAPMSSQTNQMASNYQSTAPMSSNQLNAYGSQLYSNTPNSTRVVNTNPLTGAFPQNNPQPQPGPAPVPQPSQPSVEDQARSQYFSFLDNQLGELPGLQSNLESQIGNSYGSNKSTIDTNLNNTLTDLGTSKTNITDNKISSIRDLDKYMINQLKAGDTYLGNRGASDSSANNQLQYAFGRVGTQGRADVSKQANQLYAQVDTQMTKAKTLAQDEVQKLDTWKNNQLLEVSKYIQSLRGNIDQAKATYIQSYLANIDNQVNNYKQTVSNWIVNKADSLGQVVSQLQQYGIAPNTGISDPSMPTLGQGASADNTNYLYGVAKKDQNLGY